jgi:hypothetical protein
VDFPRAGSLSRLLGIAPTTSNLDRKGHPTNQEQVCVNHGGNRAKSSSSAYVQNAGLAIDHIVSSILEIDLINVAPGGATCLLLAAPAHKMAARKLNIWLQI